MRKLTAMGLGLLVLGACTPVPDDTGVGFGPYTAQAQSRAAREAAALRGTPQPTTPPPAQPQGTADIAAVAGGAIAAAEARPAATPGNAAISDEQNFDAVAARESIESDAERRQRMIEQRVEIAPTAVPSRPGSTGPNIIEYAVTTTHPVGQQMYSRNTLFSANRHERNCRGYRSDNLAQEAFLAAGGPERDRQALDPDGDGYACGWDPTVFRSAAQAARNQ